jgi:putative transposase
VVVARPVMLVRYRPGVSGETARTVHVLPLPTDERAGVVRALCGAVLILHDGIVNLVGPCGAWKDRLAARGGGRAGLVEAVAPSYKGFRFPVKIISHCVWLYHRFPLSFREVEELMLQRGIVVSHETVRQWCAKFGQTYANGLRRRRPRPGDTWHLDEVFITINGKTHYLWRAVDQDGVVLDILVQSRRNAAAAKKFFRRLLKGLRYVPRVVVTDKLASYGAAHRVVMPSVEHRSSKYLNNRAENSHQPIRARERAMKRFTSPGHAQRFLSAFSGISPHFWIPRHLLHAQEYRREMANRFSIWNEVTGLTTAA